MTEDLTTRIAELEQKHRSEAHSRTFLQLGEAYRQNGEYEKAVRVLEEGLAKRSEDVSARVALGRTYVEMGQLDDAQKELELVVRIMPDNLLANQMLGEIYLKQGKREEAISRLEMVMTLNPLNEDIRETLKSLRSEALSDAPSSPTTAYDDEARVPGDQVGSPFVQEDRRKKTGPGGSSTDISQSQQRRETNGRFSRKKIDILDAWLRTIKG